MSPDQKSSRLISFLSYLMSHCDGSFLSMSGHFRGCPEALQLSSLMQLSQVHSNVFVMCCIHDV